MFDVNFNILFWQEHAFQAWMAILILEFAPQHRTWINARLIALHFSGFKDDTLLLLSSLSLNRQNETKKERERAKSMVEMEFGWMGTTTLMRAI